MHGIKLIEKNITEHKFPFYEIAQGNNIVDFQVENLSPDQCLQSFQNFCDNAAPGRYKITLGKNCNAENCRVVRGPQGFGTVTIDFHITNNIKADHIDVNSHNATYNKHILALQKELSDLKLKHELKEIENKLRAEYQSKITPQETEFWKELMKDPEYKEPIKNLLTGLAVWFSTINNKP